MSLNTLLYQSQPSSPNLRYAHARSRPQVDDNDCDENEDKDDDCDENEDKDDDCDENEYDCDDECYKDEDD